MKKTFLMIALILGGIASTVSAQNKMGHIDTQELILLFPERKAAEEQMQTFAKKLDQKLQTLSAEYNTKIAEYNEQEKTMTQTQKQFAQEEIFDLEKRISDFRTKAQEDLQKQEAELLSPMIEKAKTAITDVAKANGFVYVFDSSSGATVYEGGEDIMPLVKKQLGLQ